MIAVENLSIRSGVFSLTGISFTIAEGTYAVLMGGTGQGKTTLVEAICGLRHVAGGRVILDGMDMTRCKPADRGVGYVPQDLGLFPTMTVRGHLEFALRVRRTAAKMIKDRVDELAELLGIGPLMDRRVQKLSGGEAQRVALGRALAFRPRVLLLDEPLNALDETTRDRMCELLRRLQRETGVATLHITHSRLEAKLLADKLLTLAAGQLTERPLEELDKMPADLKSSPRSPRVRQTFSSGSSQ